MLNIVIGFIWKYIVMGLVFTLVYAVSMTLYIGKKTNWGENFEDLTNECLGILTQIPDYGRSRSSKEFKKISAKLFPLTMVIWPINIATALSRLPDILEHIKESTKEKS